MTEIYGHKWLSAFGPKPTDLWRKALQSLSPMEIKNGLEAVLEKHEWPPSLVEFLKLCKPDKPLCAAHRPFLKLPRPRANPETVSKNCKDIRDHLRGYCLLETDQNA